MKKLALFDIDRTLAEGSIGVLFTNFLFKKGVFPRPCYQAINQAIKSNKAGKISYQTRGRIIIENWALGLKGLSKRYIDRQAQEFFKQHRRNIYPGAKDLIAYLKKKNYYIVGISRALEESLVPLQEYLGIQKIIGTQLEYNKDICSGRLLNKMWEEGAKRKALFEIFKKINLTTAESIAFGDTEDDYYMLKFVKFPISVNANKALEKISISRHWPIYADLRILLQDIKSGKLLPKLDWFQHYAKKYGYIMIGEKAISQSLKNDRPFLKVVARYVKKGGKILEAGCGLGRLAISLSLAGYKVTAIDKASDILDVAKINCLNFGRDIKLELADIFDLGKRFRANSFAAITHGGVLEHFSDNQIKIILDQQLRLAPLVIFSVPVKSQRNEKYFKKDQMGHRNLWSKAQWVEFLGNYYKIKEARIVSAARKDDLILVIKR